jgi:hypothetical protein
MRGCAPAVTSDVSSVIDQPSSVVAPGVRRDYPTEEPDQRRDVAPQPSGRRQQTCASAPTRPLLGARVASIEYSGPSGTSPPQGYSLLPVLSVPAGRLLVRADARSGERYAQMTNVTMRFPPPTFSTCTKGPAFAGRSSHVDGPMSRMIRPVRPTSGEHDKTPPCTHSGVSVSVRASRRPGALLPSRQPSLRRRQPCLQPALLRRQPCLRRQRRRHLRLPAPPRRSR